MHNIICSCILASLQKTQAIYIETLTSYVCHMLHACIKTSSRTKSLAIRSFGDYWQYDVGGIFFIMVDSLVGLDRFSVPAELVARV